MDIFETIKHDHRQVEELFSEIENTKDSKKLSSLFHKIYQELNLHAKVEELTFYPSMREYEETEELLEEAEEEHNQVKILLEELQSLNPTSSEFKEKIGKLKTAVQHHIQEEEEEVFPKVRQSMSEEELDELSQEFEETKSKLQKEMAGTKK